MTLREIKEALGAEILCGESRLGLEIRTACGCDLMSDVLAFTGPDSLLLTGLTNPQVVRTAEMAELAAVCFVRGKKPEAETVDLAADKGIPLLRTQLPMFESCGRLHALGLAGCSEVVRTEMLEGPPVSHRSAEQAQSVCERCGPSERSGLEDRGRNHAGRRGR